MNLGNIRGGLLYNDNLKDLTSNIGALDSKLSSYLLVTEIITS